MGYAINKASANTDTEEPDIKEMERILDALDRKYALGKELIHFSFYRTMLYGGFKEGGLNKI